MQFHADDGDDSYPLHMMGHVTTLPGESENETVEQLRQVVFEITGKRVEPPVKPRMGFLP